MYKQTRLLYVARTLFHSVSLILARATRIIRFFRDYKDDAIIILSKGPPIRFEIKGNCSIRRYNIMFLSPHTIILFEDCFTSTTTAPVNVNQHGAHALGTGFNNDFENPNKSQTFIVDDKSSPRVIK